jgi:Uma2 family endonuclease
MAVAKKVDTVVQPDIAVFCSDELLDERGAHGPPDIAVEILYERHGVREYWVVNGESLHSDVLGGAEIA